MLMARNVHMSTCSPGANSDGFMNMSPVSTSGRQTLALTFAATESEHPASATTGHSVHNADYLLMSCRVCSSGSAPRTASYGHRVACRHRRLSKAWISGFTVRAGDRRRFGPPACLVARC